jgi:hypothetical protein
MAVGGLSVLFLTNLKSFGNHLKSLGKISGKKLIGKGADRHDIVGEL